MRRSGREELQDKQMRFPETTAHARGATPRQGPWRSMQQGCWALLAACFLLGLLPKAAPHSMRAAPQHRPSLQRSKAPTCMPEPGTGTGLPAAILWKNHSSTGL